MKAWVAVTSGDAPRQAQLRAGVGRVIAEHAHRTLVEASDAQLRALRDAGLPSEPATEYDTIPLPSVRLDTTAPPPTPPPPWRVAGDPTRWIVQFDGPALPQFTAAVGAAGGEILAPITDGAVLARLTRAQATALEGADGINWVGPYEPLYKVSAALVGDRQPVPAAQLARLAAVTETPAGGSDRLSCLLALASPADAAAVRAAFEGAGGTVIKQEAQAIVGELPRAALPALVALDAVVHVEPWAPPRLALDRARPISRVQPMFDRHGLDGEGQVVGVGDTGLDRGVDNLTLHADFRNLDGTPGRVTGISLGRPPLAPVLWNDPNVGTVGHGTHVSGIVLGNGSRSGSGRPRRGVAPLARLVIQSMLTPGGGLTTGAGLFQMLQGVYDAQGVRAHNNSWGTPSAAAYGVDAHDVDRVVHANPDLVVVFAAGNDAVDNVPAAGDGLVEFTNLRTETTSRNGICVGSSENLRADIAIDNQTAFGAPTFPAGPLNTDRISNDVEQMSAFSSRGPTGGASGARIKPDIVAPGCSIYSARSQLVPGVNFHGPFEAGSAYHALCGTSMAAPHVTGMCALIRQWLRVVHGIHDPGNAARRRRRPSAALVKALLIHGARQIRGAYPGAPGIDNSGPIPGYHQGWGRVDLRRSLFSHPTADSVAEDGGAPAWLPRRTVFIDDPDIALNSLPAAAAGRRVQHDVQVRVTGPSVPLRATLTWTDFPQPPVPNGAVFNQLSLTVHPPAPAAAVAPAAPAASVALGFAVASNNVQQVDIAAPAAGVYTIRVTGTNVPSQPLAGIGQDFALVVSGAIDQSDHRQPGTLRDLPDLAFVDYAPLSGVPRHDGLAPSPDRPLGDPGSPDVWVSEVADRDPARAVTRVEAGRSYFVHVRVRNLGFAPANLTDVQLFWGDPSSPLAFPGDWKGDGLRVGDVAGNLVTVDVPARGEAMAGPFRWDAPRDREQVALLVRANHLDDPVAREGDLRNDNNLTRRDVFIQDNTAARVGGEPGGFDRFIFWLISGFGSPRDIEARIVLSYRDVRDGSIRPLPAGVEVEIVDEDVFFDDLLAKGRTVASAGAGGRPASVVHLTFSTIESGERRPDIFLRVKRPAGAAFEEFLSSSFFAAGASEWSSRSQATTAGGFFLDDFTGSTIGVPSGAEARMDPAGTPIAATFEAFSVISNEFRPLPAGILVRILDSKQNAPRPNLAEARTNDRGEIGTVIARGDHKPSIHFVIERDAADPSFAFIDYFGAEASWDSRTRRGEVIAADGTVRSVPGHFEDFSAPALVSPGEKLRFRLEAPGIQVHLRFEAFDREAGAFRPLPPGVEVEILEDVAGAVSPLITGVLGADGRLEVSVPKGGRDRISLFARVVMRRRLSAAPGEPVPPTANVRRAGTVLSFDTKGRTATDGTAGAFANVESRVPAAGGPLTFRLGTGAGDAAVESAAPFILGVLGDCHDWLRNRTDGDFRGLTFLHADLVADAATGSSVEVTGGDISLNTAHTATGAAQPDHWSRHAIAHQFGHLLVEHLYVNPFRTSPVVPNHRGHDARTERNERVAFVEGVADFVAFGHRSAPTRPDASATQTGWRSLDNNGANSSGEDVPIAIANALWRIDQEVVGAGPVAIADPINRRRFQALIWRPLKALDRQEADQTAQGLYRAMQAATLGDADLIRPHGIGHVRQIVRDRFEASGIVFTRGRLDGAPARRQAQNLGAAPPVGEIWRFRVQPADRARLNVGAMGRITAYRMQARQTGVAGAAFVDLDPVVEVPAAAADQKATIDVNFTGARQTLALPAAGNYDLRVRARDELGAWDSFADDFTGNAGAVNSNDAWQGARLGALTTAPIAVP